MNILTILHKAYEQALEDYNCQWELYPGFDEENIRGRMKLALQLADREYALLNGVAEVYKQNLEQHWLKKRQCIQEHFEALIPIKNS